VNINDLLSLQATNPQASNALGQMLGTTSMERPGNPAQMPMAPAPVGINGAAPAPSIGGGVASMPSAPSPYAAKQDSGFRSFIGKLGDALLIGSGADPIYGPMVEKRELGAGLANLLGTDDPRLAELFMKNPQAAMQVYNASREDGRFDRQMGQGDRQIDQADRRISEEERSNMAREGIILRGQDYSREQALSGQETQMRIATLRAQSSAADRQARIAMQQNDFAQAERLLGLRHQYETEMARLGGGNAGTVTETVKYPGQEARTEGGFLGFGGTDIPASPERTVVTKRPAQQQQQPRTVSGPELQQYAQREGVSVEQARAHLRQNGYTVN